MKPSKVITFALLCLWGCAPYRPAAHNGPTAHLFGRDKANDTVNVTVEDDRTLVDVRSPAGIGSAELISPDGTWKKPVIFRLHLHGLEGVTVGNGAQNIHASVISRPPFNQLCELSRDGEQRSSLKKKSPFWMTVHVVNNKDPENRGIPLQDGYFDVTVPDALLSGNPETLAIRWIDFFRG